MEVAMKTKECGCTVEDDRLTYCNQHQVEVQAERIKHLDTLLSAYRKVCGNINRYAFFHPCLTGELQQELGTALKEGYNGK